MKILKTLFVFSLFLTTFVICTGCDAEKYQAVTKTTKGITFSFECPVSYQDQQEFHKYDSSVVFLRPDGETVSIQYDNINTGLSIDIYEPNTENPDAITMAEQRLTSDFKSQAMFEYELFENTTLLISGIESEYIHFQIRSLMSGDYLDDKISYVREVFFDYKGYIWDIRLICYLEVKDQVQEEFKRIVSSFKLFD